MKSQIAIAAAIACLSTAPAAAQSFSFDPLKDLESAIPSGVPNESRILQARLQVKEMANDALSSLYETSPWTRRSIERAAGYAVFSTFGLKLFFAGGTTGKGVVVNNRTGRNTFMKMLQVQGGLGFGVNQNRLIFVFANEPALRNFIQQGWEFGGQGNLSAIAQGKGNSYGGAALVSPGVYLYQITESGLAATLTVSGTKFFKDTDLN
jgi:lipid-binding SYLF domain-containing protein